MRLRLPIAAAALLTLLGTVACQAEPAPVVSTFDAVYRLDLTSRQSSFLGSTGTYANQPVGIEGLAYAPDGTLFGITDNLKALFRINPQNALGSYVGPLAVSGLASPTTNLDTSLAIAADGRAWMASAALKKLWRLDLATGATSPVGDLGVQITGLAARGGELYGAGARGQEGLYRIDPASGRASLVGSGFKASLPYAASIGLAFDAQGALWAVVNYIPPQRDGDPLPTWSDLAQVDLASGTLRLAGNITGPRELQRSVLQGFALAVPQGGAVTVDVPANSSWALALLVLLILALSARRLRGAH